VPIDLSLAFAVLEDTRDDIHRQANKAFFKSEFVNYGDLNRAEATINNCLQLLRQVSHPHPVPPEMHNYPVVVG